MCVSPALAPKFADNRDDDQETNLPDEGAITLAQSFLRPGVPAKKSCRPPETRLRGISHETRPGVAIQAAEPLNAVRQVREHGKAQEYARDGHAEEWCELASVPVNQYFGAG